MAWSLNSYEKYIYSISELSPYIESSKFVLIHRGKYLAELTGNIIFASGIRLEVRELLYFLSDNFIKRYGYLVKKNEETQYWYDSQEHPNDPTLQSTRPHHKHIPPEIKHNRIPAPSLKF